MKFTPSNWKMIEHGQTFEVANGKVHVRSAEKTALYIESEGIEALAGVGHEIRVESGVPVRARAVALDVDGRHEPLFLHDPFRAAIVRSEEVFTNIDRMPSESGNVLEVTKALRQMRLQQRAFLQELAHEKRKVVDRDGGSLQVAPDAGPEPEPEPEPQPGSDEETAKKADA